MKSDLVDLTVAIHHETDKAVLVSVDGNRNGAVWLPKSRIEIEIDYGPGSAVKPVTVSLPRRLAEDKGLV